MDTRTRLIESAQELLWERGYVGTSPKAIQDRAGAGQGSMYHHFTGKPALAAEAITRSVEELRSLSEVGFDLPGSTYDRIEAHLLRQRDVLRGCRVGRLTFDPDVIANPALREPVDAGLQWARQRMVTELTRGRDNGELPPDLDVEAVAATLVAVIQGGYVLARAAQDPSLFDDAMHGALALLKPIVRPAP